MPPKPSARSAPPAAKAAAKSAKATNVSKSSKKKLATPAKEAVAPTWAQQEDVLTTNQGTRLSSTNDSLKVGPRGPSLLEDFHLREKIMHFDHERIPERVVHARGAGAHGRFQLFESLEDLTTAQFLTDTSAVTPVFTRFSTVVGSRGSADTARDVRGFAVKFYTQAGNFDLVGNNIPVFFIQDGIKFPDLVHAVKPEPDREIPQAQSAHDTFWDFASLQPESTHMLMWVMSDRGIPRSYRTMEGFGVHTFRLVNAAGDTTLVKFHWKPTAGVHSLVWEESQKLGGIDPDFHRRDLWESIEAGAFPEYDLGVQVLPDTEEQTFEGIDLLDPTKIVPEELAPVRLIGRMTLDTNPTNFFAETEQVAFHVGHVVPGIEVTDDPLMQARLFSYLDTQLTRLGGPNFAQIPINQPLAPVNNNQRDGFHQHAVHEGRAAYFPNSVGGGCPFTAGRDAGGYVETPRVLNGAKVRERPVGASPQSFDDHYSQATLFWNSMTAIEQKHLVDAFSFELSKVMDPAIQQRTLEQLANVATPLTEQVAAALGLPAPAATKGPLSIEESGASPALSMVVDAPGPIAGRVVGVLVNDGADGNGIAALTKALAKEAAKLDIVAPHAGTISASGKAATLDVAKTLFNSQSVQFDALVLGDGAGLDELATDKGAADYTQEAYRHHKTIGAWGAAVAVLEAWGIPADAPGVVTAPTANNAFAEALVAAVGLHRHWNRV